MRRRFNITGSCSPERHYMVRLDERLKKIKEDYVEDGSYFVINRGRQYGKTTTLRSLKKYLSEAYIVLSLDFQELGTEEFADAAAFTSAFAKMFMRSLQTSGVSGSGEFIESLAVFTEKKDSRLNDLFVCLSNLCKNSPRPIVLMIDEVDSASNNQVFIEFLALFRKYYLNREEMPIFHSVILAGVYDIKNLKLKLRPESEHQYNSPWNIAAKFKIDMSFSTDQIAAMLAEYEADYHTGMEIHKMAEEIYQYTSGYPVLVSSICKYIDEDLPEEDGFDDLGKAWTSEGITRAVKAILIDNTPLFGSMIRHLDEYPAMEKMFQAILFEGNIFAYNPDTKEINLACMFGYAVDRGGNVQIANRIFETRLYNYFLSEEELSSAIGNKAKRDKCYFIHDGMLDMDVVMKKFVEHFHEIYGDENTSFVEKYGRKIFLLYLRPIINGTGNYYIEAQTRDERRTDIIVDYLGEQFIIELKIWHGNEYNERGEKQLAGYLDYYHKDKGYLLSFNFNKKKETGVKEIVLGTKTVIEAVV
ncbi:MAG: ATP-binding protein [Lachnospiraceae bacterium]|nr:ATP-binding protein [Lachnospiraceae bacterium]